MGQQCWGYLLRGGTAYPPAGSTAEGGDHSQRGLTPRAPSHCGDCCIHPVLVYRELRQPGWAGPDGFLLPAVSPCSCLPASLPFFFFLLNH